MLACDQEAPPGAHLRVWVDLSIGETIFVPRKIAGTLKVNIGYLPLDSSRRLQCWYLVGSGSRSTDDGAGQKIGLQVPSNHRIEGPGGLHPIYHAHGISRLASLRSQSPPSTGRLGEMTKPEVGDCSAVLLQTWAQHTRLFL